MATLNGRMSCSYICLVASMTSTQLQIINTHITVGQTGQQRGLLVNQSREREQSDSKNENDCIVISIYILTGWKNQN
jgi:hypothetical protein